MARSIQEILTEIEAKSATYPELNELEQNESVVQVWGMAKQVMALGIAQVDQSIDALRKELNDKINSDEHGGVEWYRQQIFKYQHGDSLAIINNRPGYVTVNPGARVVKHVSVTEPAGGGLAIKAAGNDGSAIVPLTTDQLAGLSAYLTRVKFAGITFTLSSNSPNRVYYTITVEIDKSVFNAVEAKKAIEKAIEKYHKSLAFNGTLYLSKVTDAIQDIEGIIDVDITRAHVMATAHRNELISRKYNAPAGYVILLNTRNRITVGN